MTLIKSTPDDPLAKKRLLFQRAAHVVIIEPPGPASESRDGTDPMGKKTEGFTSTLRASLFSDA